LYRSPAVSKREKIWKCNGLDGACGQDGEVSNVVGRPLGKSTVDVEKEMKD
jgi:hypothetical protein